MVNSILLEEKIKQSGKTRTHLSKKCGMSIQSLRLKINNILDFKSKEIKILCQELSIEDLDEKEKIFFANDVA